MAICGDMYEGDHSCVVSGDVHMLYQKANNCSVVDGSRSSRREDPSDDALRWDMLCAMCSRLADLHHKVQRKVVVRLTEE